MKDTHFVKLNLLYSCSYNPTILCPTLTRTVLKYRLMNFDTNRTFAITATLNPMYQVNLLKPKTYIMYRQL